MLLVLAVGGSPDQDGIRPSAIRPVHITPQHNPVAHDRWDVALNDHGRLPRHGDEHGEPTK